MKDLITSGVKTAVQYAVAAGVTWLASLNIDIAGEAAVALEAGLFALVIAVVAAALNWLGEKFPVINKIVSLGLSSSTASY